MKLLDKPIRKEAGVSNQEAIAKLLVGAGAGAGIGVLGEYMLTGKLGWKGGTLGAAVGTGASAFLNPEAREKLINTVKDRFASKDVEESELGVVPGEGVTLGGPDASKGKEPTEEDYYNNFKQQLESGQEFPEEKMQGMQQYIKLYDQQQVDLSKAKEDIATAVKLQKDPKYDKALEEARSGTYFDKLTPGADEDVSFLVHRYVNDYTRETGKTPTPDHILRFTRDTRSQALTPEGWGDYMKDQHVMSGEEEYPLSGMALQFGGGYAGSKLSKPAIEKMMKTPGGRKSLEKIFGSSAESKGLKKFLLGKGGGKGAAKLSARSIPGLNIAMDIPEFFIDPNTGEYTSNVGKNISEQDRLMELREKGGAKHFGGLEGYLPDWKTSDALGNEYRLRDTIGNKRDTLYNMSAGALRGWFNPLTSMAVAGKRYKDTAEATIDNIKDRGFLQGAKSNIQAGASALATTGSELWSPIQDALPWQKKAVKPKSYSWGSDVAAPTKEEIRKHRQANKWHRKEGEDHMDKLELVRRVIRKQASMQKEAGAAQQAAKKILLPKASGVSGLTLPNFSRMDKAKSYLKSKAYKAAPTFYNNPGKTALGLGVPAVGLGAYTWLDGDPDGDADTMRENEQPPTGDEIQDARDARDKRMDGSDDTDQVEGADIPPELLAGAGGAVAGGAAGYALAPTLGVSRTTGALGGGALTALASALLANKLKEQKPAA